VKARKFVDTVAVQASAGNGGHGCVSFRREKYIPRGGPDGGDGGNGGDVILRADKDTDSLIDLFFSPHQSAGAGGHGKGKQLHGKSGKDLVVAVPCGTEVWDKDTGEMLGDLVEHDGRLTVANGGKGGLGNCHWTTSTHQAPRESTPGEEGEERHLRLRLKTVADVGMVGFPNAGKSSLLTALTHAHPKIAPYPFTTLHPVVGTLTFEDYLSLRISDVPGLIDGAHKGVGLGHSFLRHIERAETLLFVLDMAGADGRHPADDYACLLKELELHEARLVTRPSVIVANKMDLPSAADNIAEFEKGTGIKPLRASAVTGEGIDEVKSVLHRLAEQGEEG
jgi:GTP-binding protein